MNKKLLGAMVLAVAVCAFSSCQSGPRRLTRNWDDWVNQKYTENAWLHGAVLQDIVPAYPLVGLVMAIGDILVVNPYYFWSKDAWDNKGTGYDHVNPTGAERSVDTLMDDAVNALSTEE